MCTLFMIKGGCTFLITLRETRSDSDLEGLNLTNHISAHLFIVSSSMFSCSAASVGSSTVIYKLVSSAKSQTLE